MSEFRKAERDASKAASDVLAERRRQVENEGWSTEHDDEHNNRELARAAACYVDLYCGSQTPVDDDNAPDDWPWDDCLWKPKDQRHNLVRAAALIVAEIERLDRTDAARRTLGRK